MNDDDIDIEVEDAPDPQDVALCLQAEDLLRQGKEIHEAATLLGLHSRTLRRLFLRVHSLPPLRWMQRQGIVPPRTAKAEGCTPVVCFRLAEFDELEVLARSRDMSPADLAREIVIDYLDRVHEAAKRHDLQFP